MYSLLAEPRSGAAIKAVDQAATLPSIRCHCRSFPVGSDWRNSRLGKTNTCYHTVTYSTNEVPVGTGAASRCGSRQGPPPPSTRRQSPPALLSSHKAIILVGLSLRSWECHRKHSERSPNTPTLAQTSPLRTPQGGPIQSNRS